MRTQLRLPVPMALARRWATCFLLVFGSLPQATLTAEQRSLLRAGRANEAMPLITLPQSLLLQSTDGRGLQGLVEDAASDVVMHAREAFFADSRATTVTTTAVPTTTTTVTTLDPAVLAAQLKITKDAAQARNLLVAMITRAQVNLLNRLNDVNADLDATDLRARMDLKAVNHSKVAAENMPIMVDNAEVDVQKITTNGVKLKDMFPVLEAKSAQQSKDIGELLKTKEQLEEDLKNSEKLPGAKRRVQGNQQTMSALVPRLENLERRVTKLEGKLYDGDLKKLVDDQTGKVTMNIMEDVSRGFGRFVANDENK